MVYDMCVCIRPGGKFEGSTEAQSRYVAVGGSPRSPIRHKGELVTGGKFHDATETRSRYVGMRSEVREPIRHADEWEFGMEEAFDGATEAQAQYVEKKSKRKGRTAGVRTRRDGKWEELGSGKLEGMTEAKSAYVKVEGARRAEAVVPSSGSGGVISYVVFWGVCVCDCDVCGMA